MLDLLDSTDQPLTSRTHKPASTTGKSQVCELNTTAYGHVGFDGQHRPVSTNKPAIPAKAKYFAFADFERFASL